MQRPFLTTFKNALKNEHKESANKTISTFVRHQEQAQEYAFQATMLQMACGMVYLMQEVSMLYMKFPLSQ